ncbi:hypothetical protein SPRG_17786 [Saprolegnia parasitica CBS 223.65]|uniref:Uncharacterized protein n=1 Tax=Saprolegnia parasitica (strain CBS 223.65) TaxID=695850 RepID=A0A067BPY2_SAPPC|nr:hypothetical protein SPRG_17786 [Saprolegnia parasitica CBS 223.65]KDO16717.1 hypothetical protein SPRG_17786 [Saprolegnia parasitica CBS 223.65]|eukprot:XP_012212573.1 hypothetical protein SPRG_17786 [Saprolegnia parasitica CBS 223.65]
MASAVHDAAIELQARFDTTKLAPVSSAPDFLELSSDEESDADDNNTSTSRYDDEDYEPSKKKTPTVELSVVADETDLAAKLYARMVELDALKTDMLQAHCRWARRWTGSSACGLWHFTSGLLYNGDL